MTKPPNLTRDSLRERFNMLSQVLAWSLDNNGSVLTIGERISINQERAAILRCQDQLATYKKPSIKYQVKAHIEQKVRFICGRLMIKHFNL